MKDWLKIIVYLAASALALWLSILLIQLILESDLPDWLKVLLLRG